MKMQKVRRFVLLLAIGAVNACGGDGPLRSPSGSDKDDPCFGEPYRCIQYNESGSCVQWESC